MKSFNLKKVAAVGAGLALVVASVSAGVGWSDLVNTADHTMKVNGIVVGDIAHVDDTTAAGLLAAKLAEKAVYNVPGVDTTACALEKVAKEGTGTYKFDTSKSKKISGVQGTVTDELLNYNNVDGLLNWADKSYKIGSSNYQTTMRETLGFHASPFFNTDEDVARLTAEIDGTDLNYTVTFAQGIDFNKGGGWTTGDWVDNVSSRKVEIPFLGKTYMVYKVNSDFDEMELFEANAVKTFKKGDKVEGLKGKDGKDYYVLIDNVKSDASEVQLTLYNAVTGVAVADYTKDLVGKNDKFAEDKLESKIFVTDIYELDTGSADITDFEIQMAVGKEALTLKEGEGFPYDSTKTDDEDYDYYVSDLEFNATTATQLDSITLKTMGHLDYEDEEGLKPGDEISWYDGFATLKFVGLLLPEFKSDNDEEVALFKFGESVSYSAGTAPGIEYLDDGDVAHKLPFYVKLKMTEDSPGTNGYTDYYKEFEFDGVDYTAYVYEDTNRLDIVEGSREDDYNVLDSATDAPITKVAETKAMDENFSDTTYNLIDSEEKEVTYATVFDVDDKTLWLMFGETGTDMDEIKYGNFKVVGTDLDTNGGTFDTVEAADINYYVPKEGYFKKVATGLDADDDSETFTATKFVYTDGSADAANIISIYFNADKERLVKVGDKDGDAVPFGAQAVVGEVIEAIDSTGSDLSLNRGEDDEITFAYNDWGTKTDVTSDFTLEITTPEANPSVRYWVYTKEGAGTLEGVEFEDKNVCKTVKGEDVSTAYTALPFTPILASEASATGKYIVVGGYIVNSLFADAAKDAIEANTVFGEALAASGDSVTAALGGNVYIAGYTKEDTMDAVKALIATLDAAGP